MKFKTFFQFTLNSPLAEQDIKVNEVFAEMVKLSK